MGDEPSVYGAWAEVAGEMETISRRKVQTFEAFNVDDVYNAVRPLLVKHNLTVAPHVDSVEYEEGAYQSGTPYTHARILVTYTVWHADGSSMVLRGAAEGIDTQDKATNKAMQQALKYVLIQALQIATAEPDPESDPHKGEKPAAKPVRYENGVKQALLVYALDGDNPNSADGKVLEGAAQVAKSLWDDLLADAKVEKITTKAEYEKCIRVINRWTEADKVPADA